MYNTVFSRRIAVMELRMHKATDRSRSSNDPVEINKASRTDRHNAAGLRIFQVRRFHLRPAIYRDNVVIVSFDLRTGRENWFETMAITALIFSAREADWASEGHISASTLLTRIGSGNIFCVSS